MNSSMAVAAWNSLDGFVSATWFAPLMTMTGAIVAVIVAQSATAARERHGKLKQEKRDAYVGFLDAEVEYRDVAGQVDLHRKLAQDKDEELLKIEQRLKGLDELEEKEKWERLYQKLDLEAEALHAELVKLHVKNVSAVRQRGNFLSRVDIFCSHDGSVLCRKLVYSKDEVQRHQARFDLMTFIRRDVDTHKRLKETLAAWTLEDVQADAPNSPGNG